MKQYWWRVDLVHPVFGILGGVVQAPDFDRAIDHVRHAMECTYEDCDDLPLYSVREINKTIAFLERSVRSPRSFETWLTVWL